MGVLTPPPPSVTASSIVLVELTTADSKENSSTRPTPSSPETLNKSKSRRHLSWNEPCNTTDSPQTNSSKSIEPVCVVIVLGK